MSRNTLKPTFSFLLFLAACLAPLPAHAKPGYGSLPLIFEANQGQADPAAQFLSRNKGFNLYLTSTEAVAVFPGRRAKPAFQGMPGILGLMMPGQGNGAGESEVPGQVVRMKWKGAAAGIQARGLDPLAGKSHYFIGNVSSRWVRAVSHYGKVKLPGIYPGIDLTYYDGGGKLEFDWNVHPGADPSPIALEIEGMRNLHKNSQGDVELTLAEGRVLVLKAPVAYQEVGGGKAPVQAGYVISGQGQVSLDLGDYDSSRELVVDPVLAYSSYLGGSNSDVASDIAVDPAGSAHLCGSSYSVDFPLATALQGTCASCTGTADAVISKLDPSGSSLLYSTYLGGNGYDDVRSIGLDSLGNLIAAGSTNSTDFPVLAAIQSVFAGGIHDVFVTKLDPSGSALIYSTYLGGTMQDSTMNMKVDVFGFACVAGGTNSTDFPVLGAVQPALAGSYDAFVALLQPNGLLFYSTYWGGSGFDSGNSIAADLSGNVYVGGSTQSSNFPTMAPFQLALNGTSDAFVGKIDDSGTSILYSTYLGGAGGEVPYAITVDGAGNAFVVGATSSPDFPLASPLFGSLNGANDSFVSVLNASGSAFAYSTYLGGSGNDGAVDIAVDAAGYAYVCGQTQSTDFPQVASLFPVFGGGSLDAFVCQLGPGGASLDFSSYLGGNGAENALGLALDSAGNIYIAGATDSTDFPLAGALQGANGGGFDAFVSKISSLVVASPTPSPSSTITPTASFTSTASSTSSQTPTPTPSSTATASPTATVTATATPVIASSPTDTPVSTATFTVTPVVPSTATNTPVSTATPLAGGAPQLFPNPFNPDKGEVFHLGNLAKGDVFTIYNMIGELVYRATLKGNPSQDHWDGLNANGVKVVTGIYLLVVSGRPQVHRIAVVRDKR